MLNRCSQNEIHIFTPKHRTFRAEGLMFFKKPPLQFIFLPQKQRFPPTKIQEDTGCFLQVRISQKQCLTSFELCLTSEKRYAAPLFARLIYISPRAETEIFFCLFEAFFRMSNTLSRKPEKHAAQGEKTSRHLVKTPGHEI